VSKKDALPAARKEGGDSNKEEMETRRGTKKGGGGYEDGNQPTSIIRGALKQ